MEEITRGQIKKVWALAHEKCISEKDVRDLVEKLTGHRSLRALSKSQGITFIDKLKRKGYIPVPVHNPKIIALVTPDQLSYINELKQKAGYDDDHLLNFIRKYLKRDNIRKLRRNEAGVVIKALISAVKNNREASQHAIS